MIEFPRLDAIGPDGNGLRVVFYLNNDRWAHTVKIISGSQEFQAIESIEGSDADEWPPSPPLQEWNQHAGEVGAALLLLGMAGRCHWSLSVEADPHDGALIFDAACRTTGVPVFLGSSYRCAGRCLSVGPQVMDVDSEQENDIAQGNDIAPRKLHLAMQPIGERAVPLVTGTDSLLTINAGDALAGRTVRWKYRLHALRRSADPSEPIDSEIESGWRARE